MVLGKYDFSIYKGGICLFFFLWFFACEHSPEIGPKPLVGFFERVTALVTTTVRGQLRDNLLKQKLLLSQLPSFEKAPSMNHLMEEIKRIDSLKDLAYFIETDVLFELQKPEHYNEKIHFDSPEVQRQLVLSILAGMRKALNQLEGKSDDS